MTDKAIECLTDLIIGERNRRAESALKPQLRKVERDAVRDTVRMMAEWWELDDSRPPTGPFSSAAVHRPFEDCDLPCCKES